MATLGLRLAAGSSRAARATPAWAHARRIRCRYLHERKELKYPVESGLGEFLPPAALKMVAVDYQQGLLDRLNEQVKNTSLEGKSVVQTVIEAAKDPEQILAFNYASEALNNSFFLESLRPPPTDMNSHESILNDSHIYNRIRHDFGSLEQLKSSFGAAVLGMFSSGWMWFVCDQTGSLAILPTFGPGTLLVRSREPKLRSDWEAVVGEIVLKADRLKTNAPSSESPSDSPSEPSPSSLPGSSQPPSPFSAPSQTRTFSSSTGRLSKGGYVPSLYDTSTTVGNAKRTVESVMRTGETLYPLFCVSVHEHAWVGAGYGVWGKEEYMKRFWSVLDWKVINETYSKWHKDHRFIF